MTTKVYGVCPHDCPDTCGVITEVENGRAIKFYADPDHSVTEGWLCAKVRPYLDHVYHPDRLKYPLRRAGKKGSGQWQRISWEEALAEIGERWRDIIAEYGAEAILPYSFSGTLGMVQAIVSGGRFWNRLGASQLERTICGAANEFVVETTLGTRHSPHYRDVVHSKLVIIWGHNPVSTAPHFMPYLKKAQRNGTQLIVIDPRRTRTAKGADWHMMPKPGTDGALALGMANYIVNEGLHDEAWLNQNTIGWAKLEARLAEYPIEKVAAITGVDVADIVKLARLYASSDPALIKIADGVQRHRTAGQTVRAILALSAITGQIGKLGGGLSYSSSGYIYWDGEALGKASQSPPLGRIVNMNRLGAALLGEASDPPIQSLFVFAANPVTNTPNSARVVAGLKRDDLFTVVHELFMTDTADYADIVLPATSQLEQTDLHKGYGHRVLSYNAQAIPPLGESKSNWELMGLLAKEMGFSEPWLHQSVDEVIEEVLQATAVSHPALQSITLDRLKTEGSIELDYPQVPFADGRFPTPSGKMELYSQTLADMGHDPLPNFTVAEDTGGNDAALGDGVKLNGRFPVGQSFNLISGASHHFTTSTFANSEVMIKHEGTPFVEIHPDDAAERNITHGERVLVENGRGSVELRAVVTDGVRRGVLVSPKGRWQKHNNGRNVNWLTSDALADMVNQSTFHSNRVWVRKLENKNKS